MGRRWVAVAPFVAVVAACEPSPTLPVTEVDSEVPGSANSEPGSANEVVWTSPENGSTTAYVRDPIRVGFRVAATGVGFEVTAAGTEVSGDIELDERGLVATFWPDGPLLHDTSHQVRVSFAGGTYEFTFRTSTWGAPLGEGVDVGGTYAMRWDEADVEAPAIALDLLGDPALESLLIEVSPPGTASSVDLLAARGTTGTSATQAACTPTASWPGAHFGEAPFVAWSGDGSLPAWAGLLSVTGLVVDAVFAADGLSLGEVRLSGLVDLRSVYGEEYALACARDADLGGDGCAACPGDGAPACLEMRVGSGTADRVALDVLPRSAEDVGQDPTCNGHSAAP